jgi:hypothetical protein
MSATDACAIVSGRQRYRTARTNHGETIALRAAAPKATQPPPLNRAAPKSCHGAFAKAHPVMSDIKEMAPALVTVCNPNCSGRVREGGRSVRGTVNCCKLAKARLCLCARRVRTDTGDHPIIGRNRALSIHRPSAYPGRDNRRTSCRLASVAPPGPNLECPQARRETRASRFVHLTQIIAHFASGIE